MKPAAAAAGHRAGVCYRATFRGLLSGWSGRRAGRVLH